MRERVKEACKDLLNVNVSLSHSLASAVLTRVYAATLNSSFRVEMKK